MKKTFLGFILVLIGLPVFANPFTLTAKEQQQMLNEAENWMDDMPDGIQDRLSDAVNHSIHGFYSEIEYFRTNSEKTDVGNYAVTVKDINGGRYADIPMKVYSSTKKANNPLPMLVYFHGGGWSVGSLNTTDKFCRALASEGNVMVVSVEYPLTPEHPYPAAIKTCEDAVDYIASQAKDLGGNSSRISLGGDGAGGNLALATFFNLQEQNNAPVKIHSLVLFYPLVDISKPLDSQSKKDFGRGYGFDSRLWEAFVAAYASGKNDYFQSPGNAPSSIISKLPPTLLITPTKDIIIEQVRDFASSSTAITYIEFDNALHGFITDGHQTTAFNKAVEFTNSFLSKL